MADALASQQRGQSGAWSVGRSWFERRRRGLMLIVLVLMFIVAALASRIFITIPAGHGGVLWLRFFGGTQTQVAALGEGLRIICPWDNIFIYDMRVQEREQEYQVIARDGLQVSVRSSFRWQVNQATLPKLHKEIGPNYVDVLIVPEVGSVLRERMSQYDIEQVFSSHRTQIQHEILKAVTTEVANEYPNRIGARATSDGGEDYVTLTDILLKDVTLPFRLRSAIERKLEQAQISQEYGFRIQRERLESERKKIEAQGIQAFQQTVQTGISDAYLKWRGIEATLELATSPNSKVVIVGGGSQGLPLILNTDDSRPTITPAPPADPVRAQKTTSGQLNGSINASPPQSNVSVEGMLSPNSALAYEQSIGQTSSLPWATSAIPADDASEDPYTMRSFANALGFRTPPPSEPSEVIGPNERPR